MNLALPNVMSLAKPSVMSLAAPNVFLAAPQVHHNYAKRIITEKHRFRGAS